MLIQKIDQTTLSGWVKLRTQLWPNHGSDAHHHDGENIMFCSDKLISFVAIADSGDIVGFADASLRHDYVNGCDNTPVVFLEGIFVVDTYQKGDCRTISDCHTSLGASKRLQRISFRYRY